MILRDGRHRRRRAPRSSPALADAGRPVRCLVRDPRRLGAERVRVQIALGDLADPPSFRNALRGVEAVVHLAAATPRPAPRVDRGAHRRRDVAAGRGGRAARAPSTSCCSARRARRRSAARAGCGPRRWPSGPSPAVGVRAHRSSRRRSTYAPGRGAPARARAPRRALPVVPRQRRRAGAVRADLGRRRRGVRPRRARPRAGRASAIELSGPETLTYEQIAALALRAAGRPRPRVHVPPGATARCCARSRCVGPVARAGHVGRGRAAGGLDGLGGPAPRAPARSAWSRARCPRCSASA